jgi:hypothetical protein
MLRKSTVMATMLIVLLVGLALSASSARAEKLAQATPSPIPTGSDRISANGGTIKIITPAAGATIKNSSVIVKVQTANLALGQGGTHFHLYVDGIIQGMSEGASTSIMAHDLTSGEHTFEVVVANGLHREMDASDLIKVNVESPNAATPAATSDNSILLVVALVAGVVALGGAGLFFLAMRRK